MHKTLLSENDGSRLTGVLQTLHYWRLAGTSHAPNASSLEHGSITVGKISNDGLPIGRPLAARLKPNQKGLRRCPKNPRKRMHC